MSKQEAREQAKACGRLTDFDVYDKLQRTWNKPDVEIWPTVCNAEKSKAFGKWIAFAPNNIVFYDLPHFSEIYSENFLQTFAESDIETAISIWETAVAVEQARKG